MIVPIAAAAEGLVVVPDWARTAFLVLGIAMAGFFILWLCVAVVTALHRRAYNLTKAETESAARAPRPAFLTVDHEAREEAIRRGDAYQRPADAEKAAAAAAAAAPGRSFWQRWGLFSRVGVVIIALAHVGVAIVSAVGMVQRADEALRTVSSLDCFKELVTRYWIGFLLGIIVIVAELIRFLRSGSKKADITKG